MSNLLENEIQVAYEYAVIKHVEDNKTFFSSFSSNQDSYNEWMFGNRFKEDCLVLDSFVALPLVTKFSMAAVPGNFVRNLVKVF